MSSRRAFIVGLGRYGHRPFGRLNNPPADAAAIAAKLQRDYYFHIQLVTDWCSPDELKDHRDKFLDDSSNAQVILFYFSGHGISVGKDTYLVPTSAPLGKYMSRFLERCLSAERLISDAIETCKNASRLFFFDCCRVTFEDVRNKFHDADTYSSLQNLRRAGDNDYFLFANKIDEPAFDGNGQIGPFAEALLAGLDDPRECFADQIKKIHADLAAINKRDNRAAYQQGDEHIGLKLRQSSFYLREADSVFKLEPEPLPPKSQKDKITSCQVSANGALVVVATGGNKNSGVIRLLSTRRGKHLANVSIESKAYCVDLSPDGSEVIFGRADGTVGTWCPALKNAPFTFQSIFKGPINCIAWSRIGNRIIAGSTDHSIKVFDRVGTEIGTATHNGCVWSVSCHPKIPVFVSGSKDGTVKLWNLLKQDWTGELIPLRTLGFDAAVRSVRFSAEGDHLLVGTQNGVIYVCSFEFSFDGGIDYIVSIGSIRSIKLKRRASSVDNKYLLKTLNYHPKDKKKMERLGYLTQSWTKDIESRFLDERLFVLSVDISGDNKVLAYGTNIDGYYLLDLITDEPIGCLELFSDEKCPSSSYRVPAVRFSDAARKMIIATGKRLQILNF